jgi:radical SAM protein with 4Fe4S-binding SPASM domain
MRDHFIEYRIENTNACGYRCNMCPREKQTRKIGFMTYDDFKKIIDQIPPEQKLFIHLHGFGEPLLDKSLIQKLQLVSQYPNLTSIIFTTLGVPLTDQFLEEFVDSGINVMAISLYGIEEDTYKNVHGVNKITLVKSNLEKLGQICIKKKSPLVRMLRIRSTTKDQKFVKLGFSSDNHENMLLFKEKMACLGYQFQELDNWHNYGNGRNYNEQNDNLCPVAFGLRGKILNVTWDLDVIPCCYDFDAKMKFGNLKEQTIEEIFSSQAYQDFLTAHVTNNLSLYPQCLNCDKRDYKRPNLWKPN